MEVGDTWIYAGSFDPGDLIRDAGVDASVGMIGGDATTVVGITTANIQGEETLVYEVRQSANFDKVAFLSQVILGMYLLNIK